MKKTDAQNAQILRFLKRNGSITPIDAFGLCGTMRLSARVFDLKEEGYDIWTERVSVTDESGKEVGHFGRYHLRGVPFGGDM